MAEYKVLIPLDGSRLAESSLAYLTHLKQMGDLQVTLISAIDVLRTQLPGFDEAREFNVMESYLREVAGDVQARLSIPVEIKVPSGTPSTCILEEAARVSPDLLLTTTHGRSGITRWRLGSVADKVIRAAECPVLVLGPKVLGRSDWAEDESSGPFRRILVPLDGSGLAEAAIPAAQRFAAVFDSELHFVQAVPIPMLPDAGFTSVGDVIESLMLAARDYLAAITARPGLASAKVKAVLGYAPDVLQAYVADQAVDMVVMTSHGRSGIARAALGSVTDRMIGATAPVLIVRSKVEHGTAG